MKTSSLFGIVIGASLLLTSCYQPDVVMHTIITDDAWSPCTREVTYRNVMSQKERDSLWNLEPRNAKLSQPVPECLNTEAFMGSHTDIGEGDTVSTTLWDKFKSAEEMCERTPLQLNGTRLRSNASLKKRFRWFYTEYDYTETFYCVGDTFKLPATDYADKAEISYWFTGQPNLIEGMSGAEASQKLSDMEPKITKWLNDNLFKVGFDFIVAHYDSIANPPLSREQFIELHDSLANYLLAQENDILAINIEDALHDFFHSDAYKIFFDNESKESEELNKEFEKRLNIFWFNVPYTLTMPGKVISIGNGTLQTDGTIFYPFTGERLIPQDYTITATSRVTHIWAYILTLLIILLAIGSYIYNVRRH